MQDDGTRQLALQGNVPALESLLSHVFEQGKAQARVQRESSKLQVILESTQMLEMETSIDKVVSVLAELSMDDAQTVSVYARRNGEYFPDWGQTSSLKHLKMAANYPAANSTTRNKYEFSTAQNASLGILTNRMRRTSYCLLGIGLALTIPGILFCLSGAIDRVQGGIWAVLPGLAQSFFPGLLLLIDGCSKLWGARKLGLIVTTEGHDIEHLMAAVKLMRRTHGIMAWVSMLGLAIAFLTVLLFLPIFLALLQP
ncbi:MAG: hypothetical protein AAGM36_08370 [Cyanobacteria bacterium J06597_1]